MTTNIMLQKSSKTKIVLIGLLLCVAGITKGFAYDFSVVCETGQTLYYNIIDAENHYVELTCPGNHNWNGYVKPIGNVILPTYVYDANDDLYYVTAIGDYAFYYCNGLTGDLVIPNYVTSIGDYAFAGCRGFTGGLTIPNTVTSIGNSAFWDCYGFTGGLVIPISVTSIGDNAFGRCSGFTGDLVIPNSVTSIGDDAFSNCSGFMGGLVIPNSVTLIGNYAFRGCSGLEQIVVGADNTVYDSRDNSNAIIKTSTNELVLGCKNTVIPNTVTSIGDYAFWNCNGLTGDLIIPNLVTSIGDCAFAGCNGFTGGLVVPNSVTSIGNSAFNNCSGFTGDLVIPNSVTSIGDLAFNNCSGFTGVLTIGNSVTSIGYGAFLSCTGFEEIVYDAVNCSDFINGNGDYPFINCSGSLIIGNNVERIPASLFRDSGFTGSLVIPNSVLSIGDYAFYNCSGFTSGLTIGNSVISIGYRAFRKCSGFTGGLVIPNSVTTIDKQAFSHCYGFTGGLTIGSSVTSIGYQAFSNSNFSIVFYNATNCADNVDNYNSVFPQSGISLVIGENVERIPAHMFTHLSHLTGNLNIPNSVTTIGDGAFYGCSGFNDTLTIGNSVISIGSHAFYDCNGLGSMIILAETPPALGNDVFYNVNKSIPIYVPSGTINLYQAALGWNEFYYINNQVAPILFADSNVKALCVSNWDTNGDGELSYEEAAAVTDIGQVFANYNYYNPTLITTFDELQYFTGLTVIREFAFYNCFDLTSITFPHSLTTIEGEAFSNGGMTSIVIPYSVDSIGGNAFLWCDSINEIIVEPGNPVFDSRENCNAIIETATNTIIFGCKSTCIPNSVTSIGPSAFHWTSSLTSIEIPNSVTSIGMYAFFRCTGLTTIEMPNSVTSIGGGAFVGCTGLTSIEIPSSVSFIGANPFSGCSSVEQIVVDADNPSYDSRNNCNAVINTSTNELAVGSKNTIIPNSVTSVGDGAFSYCSGLTSIEIPNSVTSIGDNAFFSCTNLASINLPSSITSIGYSAFAYCSGLTGDLTIPNSVSSIGGRAFYSCSNLSTITMMSIAQPTIGPLSFSGTNNELIIYVPYESLNAYKTASNWSNYESQIQPMAYKTVSGYDTSNDKWAFISSPLLANTAPTSIDNMISEESTNYDLYRFNQSAELEWENYKQTGDHYHFNLQNGQGYLYANAEDVNLIFKGEFNEEDTEEVNLLYDATVDFAGWNLVGNPFPVNAYANRSYYVMNEDGTAIEPVAVSMETAIPACTGVLVKSNAAGETVTFSKTVPEAAVNQGVLQVAVAQANTRDKAIEDKTIVSFNTGDILEKFVFNENNAQLYVPKGKNNYAIVSTEKAGEIPLNFKAKKDGTYTLIIDTGSAEMNYLYLVDNMTGEKVDLLQVQEYTFAAKTTDYASRFKLMFDAGPVIGDAADNNEAFAYICNGEIVVTTVNVDGESHANSILQVIDMLGHICKEATIKSANQSVSVTGITPGVYMLHLICGEKVRTQKVVINR